MVLHHYKVEDASHASTNAAYLMVVPVARVRSQPQWTTLVESLDPSMSYQVSDQHMGIMSPVLQCAY